MAADNSEGSENYGYKEFSDTVDCMVNGGKTIQPFINNNLITDLTITKIPILLGEGLSLFGKTKNDIKLKHIETKSYPSGFVKSTYEVCNELSLE